MFHFYMTIKHANLKSIYLHDHQYVFIIANMTDKYGKKVLKAILYLALFKNINEMKIIKIK